MSPEEKARLEIDKKLIDAGWEVVDRDEYSPAVSAMAVREGLLKGNKEGVVLSWVILRRHNVNYELKITKMNKQKSMAKINCVRSAYFFSEDEIFQNKIVIRNFKLTT